jgi:alpha-mannosidase
LCLSQSKKLRKNATILRFYECHNQRGPVTVKVDLPFKKICECNLMEEKIADIESVDGVFTFDIMPFEIKTFKLS